MFRISREKTAEKEEIDPHGDAIDQANVNLLSQFCVVDHWSANLANAMLKLGARAKSFHHLPDDREQFGLMEVVRCYEKKDRTAIIELFEHAAYDGRPFQFAAELATEGQGSRTVHCFGDYRVVEGTRSGAELYGLFLFSRDLYHRP